MKESRCWDHVGIAGTGEETDRSFGCKISLASGWYLLSSTLARIENPHPRQYGLDWTRDASLAFAYR